MVKKKYNAVVAVLMSLAIVLLLITGFNSRKKQIEAINNNKILKLEDLGVTDEEKEGYTSKEVNSHNRSSDCWVIVEGFVYDMTPVVLAHPGDIDCGVDNTEEFNEHHGDSRLEKYKIGIKLENTEL